MGVPTRREATTHATISTPLSPDSGPTVTDGSANSSDLVWKAVDVPTSSSTTGSETSSVSSSNSNSSSSSFSLRSPRVIVLCVVASLVFCALFAALLFVLLRRRNNKRTSRFGNNDDSDGDPANGPEAELMSSGRRRTPSAVGRDTGLTRASTAESDCKSLASLENPSSSTYAPMSSYTHASSSSQGSLNSLNYTPAMSMCQASTSAPHVCNACCTHRAPPSSAHPWRSADITMSLHNQKLVHVGVPVIITVEAPQEDQLDALTMTTTNMTEPETPISPLEADSPVLPMDSPVLPPGDMAERWPAYSKSTRQPLRSRFLTPFDKA